MNFALLRLLTLAFGLITAINCTQVTNPEPTQVKYAGMCSEEFSRAYETLLNWSENTDIQPTCNEFYTNFADTKCVSKIDGVELRLHTTDFDKKCSRGIISNKGKKTNGSPSSAPDQETAHKSVCSPDMIKFIIEKQEQFQKQYNEINFDTYSDKSLFEVSLANKRICNQYFFNHKYLECPAGGNKYSFYNLKPYCDQFQSLLHELKLKNSKQYSPQELKTLSGLNLKFHFQDPLLPFYKSKLAMKDNYLVDGALLAFNHISSGQNYCYFESESTRFAGELKNEIYQVDISYPSKSKIIFTYNSFNEHWRLVCVAKNYLYFQDLLETLGDKVSVFE